MGEYSLVRHQGLLDRELLKLLEIKPKTSLGIEPKMRGLVSSVSIAAAVTGYARIALSQYINLEGNECVYTDTDSVVLSNKLPSNKVGPEIGKMKLEYIIHEGIFIAPKTYALRVLDTNTGKVVEIFRAKGVGPQLMNYKIYQQLYSGQSATINKDYFLTDIEQGSVRIVNQPYTIKGIFYPTSIYKRLPAPETTTAFISIDPGINNITSNLSLVVYNPPPLGVVNCLSTTSLVIYKKPVLALMKIIYTTLLRVLNNSPPLSLVKIIGDKEME